ncbi:hypothetical protein GCM10022214_71940 [Actinomadura miaoliensis]|uniref:Uncharacterized protein n=1 Tax=Actinomadura miaoliensis TaxID=430685 RepID=A0ABP7WUX3_9ACTN
MCATYGAARSGSSRKRPAITITAEPRLLDCRPAVRARQVTAVGSSLVADALRGNAARRQCRGIVPEDEYGTRPQLTTACPAAWT